MNSRPPRHSDPPVPIPMDTRSAVAMLTAELRSIRLLLTTLVSLRGPVQGQGQDGAWSETSSGRRSLSWRDRKRSEGFVFVHGRATARNPQGATGATLGATGGFGPSQTLPLSETSGIQTENLETHTPGGPEGATQGATSHPKPECGCVFSYFQVLEILRGASPPLVLQAEDKVESAFRRVVEDLIRKGAGEEDWRTFARWVLQGGKDGLGGYSWKNQGPPDLWFLASPGTLAKGLGMAKQWAEKLARAKAKAEKLRSVPRPSEVPTPRPSVPPPPLAWGPRAL